MRGRQAPLLIVTVLLLGCSADSDEQSHGEMGTNEGAETKSALPWSDIAVEGRDLRLTERVPDSVRGACSDVAARALEQGWPQPVFCPPLVPDTPIKVELAGGVLRYRRFDDGYNIGFWSPGVGHADSLGRHWSIAAGATTSLRSYTHPPAPDAPAGEERPEPLVPPSSTTTLSGQRVTIYRMPSEAQGGASFYSGHVVFEWQYRGITFHVTMHGYRNDSQIRLMTAALIEEVRVCATEEAREARPGVCGLVFGRGSLGMPP